MKKLKYFSILMLVGLLTLTGCEMGKKVSNEERLEKALNKFSTVENLTMDVSLNAKKDSQEANVDATLKIAKEKKGYNIFAKFNAELDEEKINLETYVLEGKENFDVYFTADDESWLYMDLAKDELNEADLDIDELESKTEKVNMKVFKKITEVKSNKNGITKLKAVVNAKKFNDEYDANLEENIVLYFYIDKKDNITKIEVDLTDFVKDIDSMDLTVKFNKIGSTKVSVPKDVKEASEEINFEDLLTSLIGTISGDFDIDPISGNNGNNTDSYDATDIYYDILLSADVETDCSEFNYVVDFSKYNKELFLYDDEYDVSRVTAGVMTFNESCEYEITTPFVIDGKACSGDRKNMDYKCE